MWSSSGGSSHVVNRKTRSTLREDKEWTHLLQCWQCLVAQVCIHKLSEMFNKKIILVCNDYSMFDYVSDWPIFFYICRLKINQKTRQGICDCSWHWHCREQKGHYLWILFFWVPGNLSAFAQNFKASSRKLVCCRDSQTYCLKLVTFYKDHSLPSQGLRDCLTD